MYDTDNLDAVRHGTIQNQIATHNKITKFRGNIRPQPSHQRIICKCMEALFDVVKHTIRGSGIILSDINPYLNQVFLGLRGSLNHRYESLIFLVLLCVLGQKPLPGFCFDRVHIVQTTRAAVQSGLPKVTQLFDFILL